MTTWNFVKTRLVIILFTLITITALPQIVLSIERDFALDRRLGVVHVGGNYPDRRTQQDFLTWGGVKAFQLGFNSLEVFIPSNMCFSQLPYAVYQARSKYCEPPPGKWPLAQSLTEFVKHPDFAELFSQPFNTFFLTAYPLNPGLRNYGRAEDAKIITGIPYTQNELNLLREEYYNFTKYLLETYKNTGKSFAIMPMVTMDRWLSGRDFETDENPGVCTTSDDAPQNRIDNMVAYHKTISTAIHQATQEVSATGVNVYLTCEVNSVICSMEKNVKAAINTVIPYVGCDLVGYAGYELRTISYNRNDPTFITRTLDYMATKTPNHPDFGDKNIVFSEIGLQEQRADNGMFTWFTKTFLPKALGWGVPYIQFWSLGSCKTFFPGLAEQNNPNNCTGMWMFKPDGSPSKLYTFLKNTYSKSITKSPTPKPSSSPTSNPFPSSDPNIGYATCDSCGFCPPNAPPQSWESCRKCLYPDMSSDPALMESLMIDPETGLPPPVVSGRQYTFLGCLGGGAGFTEEGAVGGVVQSLLNIIFSVAGGISFLYLIYGSYIIITSQANPERLNYGKRVLYGAIAGLIFTIGSVFIVNFIASGILKIPGFGDS